MDITYCQYDGFEKLWALESPQNEYLQDSVSRDIYTFVNIFFTANIN